MDPLEAHKLAYEADITYGTNSEFGFDYLRDNMAIALEGTVQRGHGYAIVDEVDSILIDEARTPLIISGEPTDRRPDLLRHGARRPRAARHPVEGDEGRGRRAPARVRLPLRREAQDRLARPSPGSRRSSARCKIENLYGPENVQLVNHLHQALKAEALYKRDVDYVIQDGEVKIVDEFTGRIMEGRRWSEGLHQAVEAKEGVAIQEEHQTLATITLQNYFRLYDKLAGMTGTAKTEEKEFVEIYGLEVVPIPTNVDVAREDKNDLIFKTVEAKFNAVVADIKERHREGPAGARRHDRRRDLGAPQRAAEAPGRPAQGAEREGARARGRDHQGRGPGRRGHDRDEHGRPRRRHQDRRRRSASSAASTSSAPSATRRAGSTTSCAAARAARATRARRASTSPGQDDLVRLFAGDRIYNIMDRFKLPDDQPMESEDPLEPDRERAEEGRGAELRPAQERPQVRRRDERPAHGDLRAAPARCSRAQDLSEEIKQIWLPEVIANVVESYTASEVEDEWDLGELVNAMEALYGTGVTAEELAGLDREAIDRRVPRRRDRGLRRARDARSRGSRRG